MLTPEELRVIDARVHREVMGADPHLTDMMLLCAAGNVEACQECGGADIPAYTTDPVARKALVEEMSRRGFKLVVADWRHNDFPPLRQWAAVYTWPSRRGSGYRRRCSHESACVARPRTGSRRSESRRRSRWAWGRCAR